MRGFYQDVFCIICKWTNNYDYWVDRRFFAPAVSPFQTSPSTENLSTVKLLKRFFKVIHDIPCHVCPTEQLLLPFQTVSIWRGGGRGGGSGQWLMQVMSLFIKKKSIFTFSQWFLCDFLFYKSVVTLTAELCLRRRFTQNLIRLYNSAERLETDWIIRWWGDEESNQLFQSYTTQDCSSRVRRRHKQPLSAPALVTL